MFQTTPTLKVTFEQTTLRVPESDIETLVRILRLSGINKYSVAPEPNPLQLQQQAVQSPKPPKQRAR